MKHADEICYWAKHPDGTKTWWKNKYENKWKFVDPGWYIDSEDIYIVDDKWSELRKAQADGKQLQSLIKPDKFEDQTLDRYLMSHSTPSEWRIKPKETVYEWQWIITTNYDCFDITAKHFATKEEAQKSIGSLVSVFEKYKPSKRIRNDDH